mmetsp:Transcript_16496/g.26352  ORF Transcript_16496/g.26352 Transcript_16496/m.26352 type:complete len:222 (-) Transcript_16496:727-1392(-)
MTLLLGSAITTGTIETLSLLNFETPIETPFASAFFAFLRLSTINLAFPAKITTRREPELASPALKSLRVVVRVSKPTSLSVNPLALFPVDDAFDFMLTFIFDIFLTLSVAFLSRSLNSDICSLSLSFPLSSCFKRNTIPSAIPVLMAKFCDACSRGIVSFPVNAPIVCVADTKDPRPEATPAPPQMNCLNRRNGLRTSASSSREVVEDETSVPPLIEAISS